MSPFSRTNGQLLQLTYLEVEMFEKLDVVLVAVSNEDELLEVGENGAFPRTRLLDSNWLDVLEFSGKLRA